MSESHQNPFEGYEKGPDQKWTIPNDEKKGVFRFILAAARRARQLQNGQRALINTTLRKPTKIAMEEIRVGAVAVEIVPEGEPWPPLPAAEIDAAAEALGTLPEDMGSVEAAEQAAGPEATEAVDGEQAEAEPADDDAAAAEAAEAEPEAAAQDPADGSDDDEAVAEAVAAESDAE